MSVFIVVIATLFNLALLKYKWEHERYGDFFLDIVVFYFCIKVFSGTIEGNATAMAVGAVVSLALLVWPPKFMKE